MKIYDYSVIDANGEDHPLSQYEGKVLLIVNTATGCGFTPQYEDLEKMYEDYNARGFEILDIPCNQFGNQAPGSDAEIKEFCTLKYDTHFPQMKKSDVNGPAALPVYAFLKEQAGFKGLGKSPKAAMLSVVTKTMKLDDDDIRWNFTKFLVDREGNVVARFEPTKKMAEVAKEVEKLL